MVRKRVSPACKLCHSAVDESDGLTSFLCLSPYFAIDGKYAVSGAQDVSTFVNLFKALTGNQEADKDIADGERCG